MGGYAKRMIFNRMPYDEESMPYHEGGGNKYYIYRDSGNYYGMRPKRDKKYDDERDMPRHYRDDESEYDYRHYDNEHAKSHHSHDYMADEHHRQYEHDYAEDKPMHLTKKDFKHWEKKIENADGTMGRKWSKEQIMPIAQQLGIKFADFTEDDYVMTMNMLYSDYCKVLGADGVMYGKLAKAFLEDDDFEGTGSEKLALYYHCIVEEE